MHHFAGAGYCPTRVTPPLVFIHQLGVAQAPQQSVVPAAAPGNGLVRYGVPRQTPPLFIFFVGGRGLEVSEPPPFFISFGGKDLLFYMGGPFHFFLWKDLRT